MKDLKETILEGTQINEALTDNANELIKKIALIISYPIEEDPHDCIGRSNFLYAMEDMKDILTSMNDDWESGKIVRSAEFHKALGEAIAKLFEDQFELIKSAPKAKLSPKANKIAKALGLTGKALAEFGEAYKQLEEYKQNMWDDYEEEVEIDDPKGYSLKSTEQWFIDEYGPQACFFKGQTLWWRNMYGGSSMPWNSIDKFWEMD